MKRTSLWAIVAATAILQPSCGTWIKLPDHHLTILAVDRLNRGEEFTFTVNIKTDSGQALRKVEYHYKISWVDGEKVAGNVIHDQLGHGHGVYTDNGCTFESILGNVLYNTQDNWGEVAKHTFEVQ